MGGSQCRSSQLSFKVEGLYEADIAVGLEKMGTMG